jgi:hypothetical protein
MEVIAHPLIQKPLSRADLTRFILKCLIRKRVGQPLDVTFVMVDVAVIGAFYHQQLRRGLSQFLQIIAVAYRYESIFIAMH